MFFSSTDVRSPEQVILSERDIDALLLPYYRLDREEFKGDDDGLACFKKFSNKGRGVAPEVIRQLTQLATEILEGHYNPPKAQFLKVIDLLTIYSNHLDQQLEDSIHAKLPIAEKEKLVVLFLKAAAKLTPKIDSDFLEFYDQRSLSTIAQLSFYLGKALRYEGVAVELRLSHLENALKIAEYLTSLKCSEEIDPHAYQNRIPTYKLPVNYCYQELKQYEKAVRLMLSDVDLENPSSAAQAAIQVASIYKKQHEEQGAGIKEALEYAHRAVARSQESPSSIVKYNARVCLMQVLQTAEEHAEASRLAQMIVGEMDANANCGAKPTHRAQAEAILAANRQALAPR